MILITEKHVRHVWHRYDEYSAGKCVWGFMETVIYIDPKYQNDLGLLAHELFHARGPLWKNWIRSFFYKYSETFRYNEEVEAYGRQLAAYAPFERPGEADFITEKFVNFILSWDTYHLSREFLSFVDIKRDIQFHYRNHLHESL